jgi:UDP-N-acetylmuramoyl-L-alanyl-D-glutamate--2,6-diaminopimelate ligase
MIESRGSVGSVGDVLRSAGLLRESRGPGDVAVSGVCQDSREARAGDVFFAWKGVDMDGHDFVGQAAERGAVAAVVERFVDVDLPQLLVSDGRRAAALGASAIMGSPSDDLFMVGVTGTNGKSTTAMLVRHLLDAKTPTAAVGTLGVVDADGVRPGTEALTTPGPVQVAVWLWQLADGGMEAVVMEASSHALDQRRLDGVGFDVGVFTNLTQDHLDYHKDMAEYFGAKARLVELIDPDGTVVVNGDDPVWAGLNTDGRSVTTFAVDADADVRAKKIRSGANGSSFELVIDGEAREVRLPLLGRYNIENALAAAAAGAAYGLDIDEIAAGLSTVPQVSGRLETVVTSPFTVLIDFAHTADALNGALAAVRPLTEGRLIVVFGAGGDRDAGKRRPMAEAVARFADVIVLTSDNPRTEDPEGILDDLAEGLSDLQYERMVDRRAAIRHALDTAEKGDTVVLAGKGHETYQLLGSEKRPFDERVVVHECLQELGVA